MSDADAAFCSNCGSPLGREARFCSKCGNKIGMASENIGGAERYQRDIVSGLPKSASAGTGGSAATRKVFPWIFGTIQILLLIWLIASQNYAYKVCPYGQDCARISNAALLLVVGLWVVVDVILVAFYVYKVRERVAPAAKPGWMPGWVVRNYFDSIESHDHARAWQLGGKNLVGGSYESYGEQISGVASVSPTIFSVDGNEVTLQYEVTKKDGTNQKFSGIYIVQDGSIIAAREAS